MTGQPLPNRGKTTFESNTGSYAPKTNSAPGAGAQLGSDASAQRDALYVEVTGTTCHINGERGHVAGLHRENGHLVGAFVALDERPAMLYATLGASSGDRNQHSEVLSAREIDRDEFDRITGIRVIREQMGWKFYPSSGYDQGAPSGEAEQFAAVRDAYARGSADAYNHAADLIHDLPEPTEALNGHVLRHPYGDWSVTVPDVAGYEMADKVLDVTSKKLRDYAAEGFTAAGSRYARALTENNAPERAAAAPPAGPLNDPPDGPWGTHNFNGDPVLEGGDTCPVCEGHGYGREIGPAAGGGTLHSGECLGCGGSGQLPNTGTTRICTFCAAEGHRDDCEVCGGHGRVRTTATGQPEVYVPGVGSMGRMFGPDTAPFDEFGTYDPPTMFRIEADALLGEQEQTALVETFHRTYGHVFTDHFLQTLYRDSDSSILIRCDDPGRGNEPWTESFEHFAHLLDAALNQDSGPTPSRRLTVYTDRHDDIRTDIHHTDSVHDTAGGR